MSMEMGSFGMKGSSMSTEMRPLGMKGSNMSIKMGPFVVKSSSMLMEMGPLGMKGSNINRDRPDWYESLQYVNEDGPVGMRSCVPGFMSTSSPDDCCEA